jgi:hypothetical protein
MCRALGSQLDDIHEAMVSQKIVPGSGRRLDGQTTPTRMEKLLGSPLGFLRELTGRRLHAGQLPNYQRRGLYGLKRAITTTRQQLKKKKQHVPTGKLLVTEIFGALVLSVKLPYLNASLEAAQAIKNPHAHETNSVRLSTCEVTGDVGA